MPPILELLTTVFLLSALSLSMQQKHFMYALLCIEAMVLSLFLMMSIYTTNLLNTTGFPMPIILLTLAACEASVGLSLMVSTIRTNGNDLLSNLNLL
uniref:NADH-ubiquinone oxidoreductase chain 4L n=1 Tax=Anilios australis TaxID=71009 RepID=A0PDP3_9SAUR|nr:NADH dehydrogenase subunit 4L [Anilios australis]